MASLTKLQVEQNRVRDERFRDEVRQLVVAALNDDLAKVQKLTKYITGVYPKEQLDARVANLLGQPIGAS